MMAMLHGALVLIAALQPSTAQLSLILGPEGLPLQPNELSYSEPSESNYQYVPQAPSAVPQAPEETSQSSSPQESPPPPVYEYSSASGPTSTPGEGGPSPQAVPQSTTLPQAPSTQPTPSPPYDYGTEGSAYQAVQVPNQGIAEDHMTDLHYDDYGFPIARAAPGRL